MNPKQIKLAPTRRTAPGALALAAALSLGGVFTLARAEGAAPASATPAAATKSGDTTDALLKFSQAGHDAYNRIRVARVELFNGHTDAAMKDLKAAQASLMTAKAEAPTFVDHMQTKEMGKVVETTNDSFTADAVPVGGDLVLADTFQVTEKQKPALAKANEHLAKGDKKAAVAVLKAGAIDVSYDREWLPIASAQKNLDQAINLASSKKYYEANLALKAIEDGVRVDSVSLDVPPAAS